MGALIGPIADVAKGALKGVVNTVGEKLGANKKDVSRAVKDVERDERRGDRRNDRDRYRGPPAPRYDDRRDRYDDRRDRYDDRRAPPSRRDDRGVGANVGGRAMVCKPERR